MTPSYCQIGQVYNTGKNEHLMSSQITLYFITEAPTLY